MGSWRPVALILTGLLALGPAGCRRGAEANLRPAASPLDGILGGADSPASPDGTAPLTRPSPDEIPPPEFPDLHDDPLAGSDIPPDQRDPFLFPWAMNLLVEDVGHLRGPGAARAERLGRQARADIRFPGPDTANFPNSAYTLPKGRFYLETSPVGFYGPTRFSPGQYNWEFLARYGLTDNLELRLFSSGYTVQLGRNQTTGFSPLAFDFKMNFWEENPRYLVPAMGVEIYIQTTFGSDAFNGGTQPSVALLFDHTLPLDINFEYNFAMVGFEDAAGNTDYAFGFNWAFQRELIEDVEVFAHGFYNAPNLPKLPALHNNERILLEDPADVVYVGAGAIWSVSNRLSIFGSYNAGLTRVASTPISYLGFAVAF